MIEHAERLDDYRHGADTAKLVDHLIAATAGYRGLPVPHDADAIAREIITDLRQQPLLLRWIREREGVSDYRNTEAWTALAERQSAAMLLAAASFPDWEVEFDPDKNWGCASVCMALLMLRATPYLWRSEPSAVALNALLKHVIAPDCLPVPLLFWSLEAALTAEIDGVQWDSNWLMVAGGTQGMLICCDRSPSSGVGTLHYVVGAVKYRTVWPAASPPTPS